MVSLLNKRTFHVRSSAYSFYLMICLYGGIVYIWFNVVTTLPSVIKMSGLLVHGIHFYITWQSYFSHHVQHRIKVLWCDLQGQWYLRDNNGNEYIAFLQKKESICTFYLTLLHFQTLPALQSTTIIIVPDSLSKEELRRLRCLLWWEVK